MTDKLGKNNERGQGRWKYFFPRILSDCQLITEMNNWWTYDGASSWISCYLLEHERVMSWEKMWENGWVDLKSKEFETIFYCFLKQYGFLYTFFPNSKVIFCTRIIKGYPVHIFMNQKWMKERKWHRQILGFRERIDATRASRSF